MNAIVKQFVDFVISSECPQNDKGKVKKAIQAKFNLVKDRSIFYCNYFAVRVSFTKTKSFSNTVLALSALQKYDKAPFFAILVSGVDKFLEVMAKENTIFCFYFIGIDEQGIMNTILCSVYHKELIEKTVKQFHWAGRNSRGVTQLEGEALDKMLKDKSFKNVIDKEKAKKFIDFLLKKNT